MTCKKISLNKYLIEYDALFDNKIWKGKTRCDSTQIDESFVKITTDLIKEDIHRNTNCPLDEIIISIQNIQCIGKSVIELSKEDTVKFNNLYAEEMFNAQFLKAVKNNRKSKGENNQ